METIEDAPVTKHEIVGWADEAEQGYDVDRLRRRGCKPAGDGPRRVTPVRLEKTVGPRSANAPGVIT